MFPSFLLRLSITLLHVPPNQNPPPPSSQFAMEAETAQSILAALQDRTREKDDLQKQAMLDGAEIARLREELNATKEEARLARENALRLMTENATLRANQSPYTARELVVMKKALDLTPRMVKLVLQNQGVAASSDPIDVKDAEDYEHLVEFVHHALGDMGV